ncbi:MAG: signal peptidase I [Oscillospiraceae bacterium]|nr:signal peptidase I [Oscillospiraceae bacterium]
MSRSNENSESNENNENNENYVTRPTIEQIQEELARLQAQPEEFEEAEEFEELEELSEDHEKHEEHEKPKNTAPPPEKERIQKKTAVNEGGGRRPTAKQIEKELSRINVNKKVKKSVFGTVRNLIFIAAAAVLVANLLIAPMTINRSSMDPTMQDGEVVLALRFTKVESGDIIAFYYNNMVLLKRVIAKAGDWVDIDADGSVYVNDEPIDEHYLEEKSLEPKNIAFPYQVPDGSFFVMGDNRSKSNDSRLKEIGAVSSDVILGKIVARIWPLSKLDFFWRE